MITPLIIYFVVFRDGGYSDEPNDWADFMKAFFGLMAAISTLTAAAFVYQHNRNQRRNSFRIEYTQAIETRDIFWNEFKKMYEKYLQIAASSKGQPSSGRHPDLHRILAIAGIPPELRWYRGKRLKSKYQYIYNYDIKDNSYSKEQMEIWNFCNWIYPLVKENECSGWEKTKEEEHEIEQALIARSRLGDFWERVCKSETFGFIKREFSKEYDSLCLLTWCDIPHRQQTNAVYDRGKVMMYIVADELHRIMPKGKPRIKNPPPNNLAIENDPKTA